MRCHKGRGHYILSGQAAMFIHTSPESSHVLTLRASFLYFWDHHWEKQGRPESLSWLLSHREVAASGHSSVALCISDILKPSQLLPKRKQKLSLPSGRHIEQREEKSKHRGHPASPAVRHKSSSVLSWRLLPAGTQTPRGLPLGNLCHVCVSTEASFP